MQNLRRNFFEALLRFRVLSLALVAVCVGLAGYSVTKLSFDNSIGLHYGKEEPALINYLELIRTFGQDRASVVLVKDDDVLSRATLQKITALNASLQNDVPYVEEILWLGTAEKFVSDNDSLTVEPLFPYGVSLEELELGPIRDQALNNPAFKGRFVSEDGKSAALLVRYTHFPADRAERNALEEAITNTLYDVLEKHPDLEAYVAGDPVNGTVLNQETRKQMPIWVITAIVGILFALSITTRSVIGVIVPLGTVVFSVLITMGVISFLDYKISLITAIVPVVLLAVAIGDTMHVVAEFRQSLSLGMPRREALLHTLDLVFVPVFLTTLTTSAGFAAFTIVDLQVLQDLGLQSSIGIWIAFFLTFFFATPILSFGRQRPKIKIRERSDEDRAGRFLLAIFNLTERKPKLLFSIFVFMTIAALASASQLVVEDDTIKSFPEDHKLRVAIEKIDETIGGTGTMDLLVNTGKPDGIKSVPLMRQMDQITGDLSKHPRVRQVNSIATQIKQTHRALHNNDPAFYAIPDQDSQISEYLFLYETSGGEQLDRFVSFSYDKARIALRTESLTMREASIFQQEVTDYLAQNHVNLDIVVTGGTPLFVRLGELIAAGQVQSFMFALLTIALIMIGMLRSVKLGLLAMIPNVLPVILSLGFIGVVTGKMSIMTILLAPLILGVAVDDTVHFFTRYRRHFNELGNYKAAYKETMRTVGRPLMFTSIVLLAGLSAFAFAMLESIQVFAWAGYFALGVALFADFILAAILIKWLKPLGPERVPQAAQQEV